MSRCSPSMRALATSESRRQPCEIGPGARQARRRWWIGSRRPSQGQRPCPFSARSKLICCGFKELGLDAAELRRAVTQLRRDTGDEHARDQASRHRRSESVTPRRAEDPPGSSEPVEDAHEHQPEHDDDAAQDPRQPSRVACQGDADAADGDALDRETRPRTPRRTAACGRRLRARR